MRDTIPARVLALRGLWRRSEADRKAALAEAARVQAEAAARIVAAQQAQARRDAEARERAHQAMVRRPVCMAADTLPAALSVSWT